LPPPVSSRLLLTVETGARRARAARVCAALIVITCAVGACSLSKGAHGQGALATERHGRDPASLSRYDRSVMAAHPVGFWDVSAARPREPDLSLHKHTGRYRDGLPSPARLPDGEQAADFNGRGQYLSVPSSPQFSISKTGKLTWEAWIRPDILQFAHPANENGYVDWMGKCEHHNGSCEWKARIYSARNAEQRCDRLSAYVFNPTGGLGSGANWQPDCGAFRPGLWLYVVGEYQTQTAPPGCGSYYPGTINIWVNAVKQNFASNAPTGCMSQYDVMPRSGTSPVNVGSAALDSWFPGAVGKVAIYDTLLSQAQIEAHYELMAHARPHGRCARTCTLSS
jgi:Concanavalin A-like lectin/glucanases superfamily